MAKFDAKSEPQPRDGSPPVKVIDIDGFQSVEDKIILQPVYRGDLSPDNQEFVDNLSRKVFGCTEYETLFEVPDEYYDLPDDSKIKQQITRRHEHHERRFQTEEEGLDEEDVVKILLNFGLDFRDSFGRPLRCTWHFNRQVEAAAKGLIGHLPSRESVSIESWTKTLERDAAAHLKNRRR